MRLYNSLSRKKEEFRPLSGKRVHMFVCGPTVYGLPHIGHARTYIAFDVLARFLRKLGYDVFYLQNITDIDDKIIARANKEGRDAKAVAREFESAYYEDMKALAIRSVTKYARASAYIPAIIGQVERLMKKGFAYRSVDSTGSPQGRDVYFRVRKFKRYGSLSRQKIADLKQFEPGEKKEDPLDFALWKGSKPGEPKWKSPWGWGRPGWHIEDTAITETFFGPQYDIHGGGIDLIFPHHECEVAQQEASSGKTPFVKYWLHTGHLTVGGEKMSKSLGNFVTIREILKKTSPEVFRLLVLSSHWRSPLQYSEKLLKQAEAAHAKIRDFSANLKRAETAAGREKDHDALKRLEKESALFYDTLADDLNTPAAIAHLFTAMNLANPLLERGAVSNNIKRLLDRILKDADAILGIVGKPQKAHANAEVEALIKKREEFRKEKKWHAADELRRKIERSGWIIEDTVHGSRIKRKAGF